MKNPSINSGIKMTLVPRKGEKRLSLYELCFLSAALLYILLFSN